ncbi:MAG TPA: DUF748 domain-containing protein, partial [Methylophaga sp.]|nr:DUF748 domain-containing protein [Methylophaga sp.]
MKYRALLIGVFGIVLLYTLLGFLLVPWLAERQMLQTLQQRLGVAASVESVQFNPYTFEVSVENLQLANKQYDPLASWDRLYFNLQPLQLFLLNLRIEEITIDAQKLHFRRYAVGDNTLTRLVENWNASTKEAVADDNPDEGKVSEQDGSLFTLQIGEFNYNDGQLIYRDDVPATTFKTVLSPINIHLDNFSTAAGQTAATDLVIALENDAKLTLNGTMIFPALQFTGMVNLQHFSLQIPYRYLQGQLPIELKNGLLDLKLAYDIDLSDTANIELSNVDLNLSQFSLYRPAQSSAILQGGTLIVSNGHYDFPDNQLSIDKVSAEDFKVAVVQNNQGELNWLQMLSPLLESDADDTSEDSKMPPLQLNIANLQLDNTALTLKDQQPVNPVNLALTVSANVQNFSLADD